MKIKFAIAPLLIVVCVLALPAWPQSETSVAEGPVVRKLDPPNWWTHFTPELSVLVTGENLGGARVESATKGLAVLGADASANGHYLFVRLKLAPTLHAGDVDLRVRGTSGATTIHFPVLARRAAPTDFQGFSPDDVIYLIMPDRFADGDPSNDQPKGSTGVYDRSKPMEYHGGDLRGIREHLGYLHDLGVTTLWLTPVWKNTDSDYHGYHVVDFYAIDEHMGSLADYQGLVADAHRLGMKVLMDFVANHTGPHHPWVTDPPTATWFHGSPAHHLDASYSFAGLVDPHASAKEYRNTLEGWFAGKLPDLNPDDPRLGLYLAQNALWWAETAHLDGFRIDTFPYSSRKFWSGWDEQLLKVYPHLDSVGEVADGDPMITSFFEGGHKQFDGVDTELATVFDFPFCAALRDVVIKGEPMDRIVNVLEHDSLYPHPEMLVTFLGNHDDKRFMGEQGSNIAKLKAAMGLLLTIRGVPQIYSGDEIGMTGGDDPDNRRDFPGGFPGDPANAFTAAGRNAEQQGVFSYIQAMMALRKEHRALRTGKQWHIGWDATYYAFLRESGEDKVFVIYNNAATDRELKVPIGDTPMQGAQQLDSIFSNVTAHVVGDEINVTLPAQTLAVFKVR
jgi:glycosidase